MGAISLGRSFPALYVRPLESLSDERLASLVHGGNDEAFEILFQRYRAPLSRYCRSIVRDPEDARDAHQSTMLAALRALRDRRLSGRVRPWLYRIAHNESITVLRRRRGHEQLDEQTPSPRAELAQLEQWEVLISDLRTLPERQRGALLMRELGGLEYHEIGAALGMSAIRARKVVFEARSALSDNAAGRDTDCSEVRLKLSDCDGRALRGRRLKGHLEVCAPCAAFALSVTERRRALALIPVGPGMPIGVLGSGIGVAAGAGGMGGGGIAAGGVAIGTGSAGLAAKGIASAVCALCAIAGAGVMIDNAQHRHGHSHAVTQAARPQASASRALHHAAFRTTATAPRRAAHRAIGRSTTPAARRAATAATVRVSSPSQRVGRAPTTKIAPAAPSVPTTALPTAATTSTPAAGVASTPSTGMTAPPNSFAQLLQRLLQDALAASANMSPAQQSALSALEQQWQSQGGGAVSSSTYTSVEELISNIMSGRSGTTGTSGSAGWSPGTSGSSGSAGWSPATSWPSGSSGSGSGSSSSGTGSSTTSSPGSASGATTGTAATGASTGGSTPANNSWG